MNRASCDVLNKLPQDNIYFKTENGVLYNGDCLEIMQKIADCDILVDLVLTDPPYNISRKNNFKTMGRSGIDFGEWDKDFDLFSWIDKSVNLLNRDGSLLFFNDWKNIGEMAKYAETKGMAIKDLIRWEKTNPMPRNIERRYVTDFELCAWLVKKRSKWIFNRQHGSYEEPKVVSGKVAGKEKTEHKTQKPLKVIERLLKIHTNKNSIVIDPFVGSGTTAVAAERTGRKWIGIEISEKYCEIAKQRLLEITS